MKRENGKPPCLILSQSKNRIGISESELIIAAITIIVLISIVTPMFKIDRENAFEKYVGEGSRKR